MSKGKFIVIEGAEASGKDTQIVLLDKWAKDVGIPYHHTCEPTYGPIGQLIRNIFTGRIQMANDPHMFDHQMAYLFAADRHDHFYNPVDGIQKMLDDGITVVSMRYYMSSHALHCSQDGDGRFMHRLNDDFPLPDLTVFLDIEPEESIRRLKERRVKDTYEKCNAKIHLAHANYLHFFSTFIGKLVYIDGMLPPDKVHEQIVNEITKLHMVHFERQTIVDDGYTFEK